MLTVRELIEELSKVKNQDAIVHVGCEGYATINYDQRDYQIVLDEKEDIVLISDNCDYEREFRRYKMKSME